jgi:hypothetical protein
MINIRAKDFIVQLKVLSKDTVEPLNDMSKKSRIYSDLRIPI